MNNRLYALARSGNPVVQVLSLFVFGVALIGAVIMGAVILSFVFGLAVVAAIVIAVRLWWLRRKLDRQARQGGSRSPAEGNFIEAEYTVVTTKREPQRRRRD